MNIKRILSMVLVIVWMVIVFYFSHQQGEGSGNMSRTVATKVVEIIDIRRNIAKESKNEIAKFLEPIIRKLAHFSIYVLGGIIICNCIIRFISQDIVNIILSGTIGIIYAISDEIHQLFIIGRSGNVKDELIDSLGVFIGICVHLLIIKIIDKFRANSVVKGGE